METQQWSGKKTEHQCNVERFTWGMRCRFLGRFRLRHLIAS